MLLTLCLHFLNVELNDINIEKVWNHGTKLSGQGFKCGYCGITNKGGGATRLRDHLGGIVGEVKSCNNVPRAVRDAMRELRSCRWRIYGSVHCGIITNLVIY